MPRIIALLVFFAAAFGSAAVPPSSHPAPGPELGSLLNFEREPDGSRPGGWRGGPADTLFVDEAVVHTGRRAARLERSASSAATSSALTSSVALDRSGRQVELRGYLRTEAVTQLAGLWLRQDGDQPNLALDNMARRPLKGTTEWQEYSVSLPVHRDARTLFFGVYLVGTGKVWADNLQLLVDGKPIWEAPPRAREESVLDRDREFDAGSKVAVRHLTPLQVENLATLGRVWGFLKYHHPAVTSGQFHWDYALFRVLPAVLAAEDRAAANSVLAAWIEQFGPLTAGTHAPLPGNLHLRPELGWIDDRAALGARLSRLLRTVRAARPSGPAQFYVSRVPNVGNPSFDHELNYPNLPWPDAGFQLLALFRFWNVYRYWSPYRDLVAGDWDATLTEFIPRFAAAGHLGDYQRTLLALIARVHDTHANLWSGLRERPPVGEYHLPAVFRFIEGRATVVRTLGGADPATAGLQRGDVLLALGGTPVGDLVREWSPLYAASNEPTRLRDIARSLGRGPPGPVGLRVTRDGREMEMEVARVSPAAAADPAAGRHDLPDEAFRLLSPEVAYLKLSSVKLADIEHYVAQALGTKGWVIDIRNYPAAFVVFALGAHLVARETEFACFTTAHPGNPGAFAFGRPVSLRPKPPHYGGKVVLLIDEVSQSQAEYTTMALRVAPGAVVVGSTTAGADGNVSRLPLPGGQHAMISGIGVFYPDRRPTQRIGIVPDVEVRPTLAGIRAGRDEVLEAALRQILGSGPSDAEIRALVPAHD
jgi:hypothetical protein